MAELRRGVLKRVILRCVTAGQGLKKDPADAVR